MGEEAMEWEVTNWPWELTPWWHPRRWFGFDVRRWLDANIESRWVYGRSAKVARELLRREYDITEATDRDHDMIFGNDGHGNL